MEVILRGGVEVWWLTRRLWEGIIGIRSRCVCLGSVKAIYLISSFDQVKDELKSTL